jgi:hypothetical protein
VRKMQLLGERHEIAKKAKFDVTHAFDAI